MTKTEKDLRWKTGTLASIVGLIVLAATGWATVVLGHNDVKNSKAADIVQNAGIIQNAESIEAVKDTVDLHAMETDQIQQSIKRTGERIDATQMNIETMQRQFLEEKRIGTERYIELIRLNQHRPE